MTQQTSTKRKRRKAYGFDKQFEQDLVTGSCLYRDLYEKISSELTPSRLGCSQAKVCLAALQWVVSKTGTHPESVTPVLQRIEHVCQDDRKITPEDAEAAKEWLKARADKLLLPTEDSMIKTASVSVKNRMLEDVVTDIDDGGDVNVAGLSERIEAVGRIGEVSTNRGMDWNDTNFSDAFLDLPNVHRIPFGITQLDECIEGGYGQGHFSLILAGTNAGKSFFLVNAAVYAACMGYDVAYATLEMNEQDTYTRAFSCLTGVPLTQIKTSRHCRELALKRRKDISSRLQLGSIRVKFFDSGTPIDSITGWVETEDRKTGKNHKVVIVDYLDKVGTTNGKNAENGYTMYGNIFESFRIWSLKNQKYGLSASQSKRLMTGGKKKAIEQNPESQEKSNPLLTSEDISDSLNKSRVVDLILGLTDSYITVVKNRHGPVGGVVGEFEKPTSVGCVHPDYISIGMKMAGLCP